MKNIEVSYEKTVKFLKEEMTTDDMKNISLSNSTLYMYKKEPDKMERASFSTVIKINEYMIAKEEQAFEKIKESRRKIKYIGVDLGTKHFMSLSDIDMEHVQTIHDEKIETIASKFKNGYKEQNITKEKKKSINNKLYTRLRVIMPRINKMITNHWHEDVILVIGKPSIRSGEMLEVFFKTVLRLLDKNLDGIFTVQSVNEHHTSVTCPKCNHGSNDNRTKLNKFICRRCGFQHNINDEVAARNILNKYAKLNNIDV